MCQCMVHYTWGIKFKVKYTMLMRKLHTIFLIKTIVADNLSNTFFQFSINLNCLTKSLAKNVNVFEIAFYVC